MKQTDYLIIGAGIAGLATALHLKDAGRVTVITKGKLKHANTYWAQGGIAAVLTKDDRFKKHIEDTMEAGNRHNNRDAVRYLVEHAPRAIRFLESLGVKFKKEPALEGGHSVGRIWRTSDFTGQDVLDNLIKAVMKEKNIEVEENIDAVELIVRENACKGVYVRVGESEQVEPVLSKYTILATGGLGQLFEKTSNTKAAAGDGLALAMNAGLELEDIEFLQFHPTALDKYDESRYFLLSETLRGFGAKIINSKGESFLEEYDKRAELAPRDIVTRAIYFEMMNGPVYLDMRYFEAKEIKNNFPNIAKRLKQYGYDISKDTIPVTPVAHFACGGIPVNLNGETKLPGLFAVGEVACSKVHGANRLPSNALLEGLVFGESVGRFIMRKKEAKEEPSINVSIQLEHPQIVIETLPQVKAYAKRISQIMWDRVGIVRTMDNLKEAMREIEEIPARDYRIQHRQMVCYKMIQACMSRPQSLGCHYIVSDLS